MTEAVAKTCKLCSTNLNGQKRVKNASGEYYCPECWKSYKSIFGDDAADAVRASVPVAEASPVPPRPQSGSPSVQIVRSEPELTVAQAAVQGLKEGVAEGLFKIISKVWFCVQFILALGLTKKLSPGANNGMLIIVGLTAGIAAMLEIDLVARMLKLRNRWLDAETLKSTVGILMMIGFGLAYALAIFLAITGA